MLKMQCVPSKGLTPCWLRPTQVRQLTHWPWFENNWLAIAPRLLSKHPEHLRLYEARCNLLLYHSHIYINIAYFFASGGRPKPKIKAKANAPLSDVSLASKTLPEKVQALRAGLGFSLCFPFLINNHACFQFFIC